MASKNRLAEAPDGELKEYQRRILKKLHALDFPEYVFSGVKKRSYIDNTRYHRLNKVMFVIDISKFFPSISRDRVYRFFRDKLNTSPDVAEILANFATIDLDRKKQDTKNMIAVNQFMQDKQVETRNHLATGSPFSPLLSYLVNVDLFDELQEYSQKNGLTMSVYIDDVAFSSSGHISTVMQDTILGIVKKHRYKSNKKKCRFYDKQDHKRITGGIISREQTIEPQNKILQKLQPYLKMLRNKQEFTDKQAKKIRGLLSAIQMTDKQMPNLERAIRMLEQKLRTA